MSIIYNENAGTLTLSTKSSVYQMKVDEFGVLLHTYYGTKIGEQDLSYGIFYKDRGFSGNPHEVGTFDRGYSMDLLPQEISTFGAGDHRITGLKIKESHGASVLSLRVISHEIIKGKYEIPGLPSSYGNEKDIRTLIVHTKDREADILVDLYYGVFEEKDVITRALKITNGSEKDIQLLNAGSMTLDFITGDYDLLTFNGKWAGERIPQRERLNYGIKSIGSVRGASSHHYNPSCILCDPDTNEDRGNAYGFAFAYSGEFLIAAEKDPIDQTRLCIGIHPDNFSWTLQPGESFMTPEVIMTWSDEGFSGISHVFHEFIRENIVRGPWKNKRRPLLVNNWEGTYFNFNGEKLVRMAEDAKKLGIEMFVLDDGWFGHRNDDNSSLGDWTPNEQKLGMTMEELGLCIQHAGLRFGLWFEPEMVSEDSDLFREHPDWAVSVPGRFPALARNQLVLDVSRTDVQDYLIEKMESVIRAGNLSYVKWDFNRSISDKYSHALPEDRQGEMAHRFVLGTYRILETLLKDFPNLLIEGCASGGGRFDCGMLYYTPQIWTSDNTDAIARLAIQTGTSYIYPVSAMGAHVSVSPNHQTGRNTPMKTRSAVAMSGTFGYELDVTSLSKEDRDRIKTDIQVYKENSHVLQYGDYYRLLMPDHPMAAAWEQVTKDGRKAVVTAVYHHVKANMSPVYIRLKGLKGFAHYRLSFIEGHEPKNLASLHEEQKKLWNGEITLRGDALMNRGIFLPQFTEEFDSVMFTAERI